MSQFENLDGGAAAASRAGAPEFSEALAWADVAKNGWQRLHGNFREQGYSLEWHRFTATQEVDWARSFHPASVEICVNLRGRGTVRAAGAQLDLSPLTAGFYLQDAAQLQGTRALGERHEFITIEFSFDFLRRHLPAGEESLHEKLRSLFNPQTGAGVSEPLPLTAEHQRLVTSLRQPPMPTGAGQRLWSRAKALEFASLMFYPPETPVKEEMFCQRQKRLNHERVQRVIAVLKEDLSHTPTLEEIGRRVGCSRFYLSRIFTQEAGKSIFHYLRELRLQRAAQLLREGRLNVTEVAVEMGYSSPSHFSTAFHAMFGCCPGLYPLATTSQRPRKRV